VNEVSDERVLALLFELVLSFALRLLLVFRLAFRFVLVFALAIRLPLFVLVIFVIANIRITSPMPINTSTAPIPRSQGQTLRFRGALGGIGDHAGGGWGGGGGVCPGNAIVGGGVVGRPCGYWTVALGSKDEGAVALTNGDPSSRQKLSASSE
jgi:hypothetical protein